MKNVINQTHIEGVIYEHALEMKTTGPNSKAPGTQFITGTLSVATDNACVNVVPVHFTYVTATTSRGSANATFTLLKNVIDGVVGTYMKDGKDKAGKVRIDSALGLNEFYSDRNGKTELVSTMRNEGGFVHMTDVLDEDEKKRNTFTCDMLITNVIHVDADSERGTEDKAIVKGAIFDFRKSLLPVEFTVVNPNAMNYFEGLGATQKEPVFTKVWGRQVSESIVRTVEEESAFGEPFVREIRRTNRAFIITGAIKDPYVWDDESTMTSKELIDAIAARETYLAGVKQRQDEYNASKGNAAPAATTPANSAFNF